MMAYTFKRLLRIPVPAVGMMLVAAILSVALCSFRKDSDAQIQKYDEAYASIPVHFTVTNLSATKSNDLNIPAVIADVFTQENGLASYVSDLQRVGKHAISGEYGEYTLVGITSTALSGELWEENGTTIQWQNGCGEGAFAGTDFVCLVPDTMPLSHDEESGISYVTLDFGHQAVSYECRLQVIGTYRGGDGISVYCPYAICENVYAQLEEDMPVQAIQATLRSNDDLEKLRIAAKNWFAQPNDAGEKTAWGELGYTYYPYALDIQDELLQEAVDALEKSIEANQICSALVLCLSAGAGLLLGFFTVRRRKQEIVLLRTLGVSHLSIFLSFAAEPVLCFGLGAALGGSYHLWQPAVLLGMLCILFVAAFSIVLCASLRKRSLAVMKEPAAAPGPCRDVVFMKSTAQLLRQPIKTVSGMILVALAVAILCVCVGQALVASHFEASLGQSFTTIALPTEIYQLNGYDAVKQTLPEEVSAWIRKMQEDNPDIIKAVAAPGLASAYVPELEQDNHTNYPYNTEAAAYRYLPLTAQPTGAPYCCALLEITLTEIGSAEERNGQPYLNCVGIVESILGLEAGYPDSTGFTAYLSIPLSEGQSADDFEIGARYLVYGLDYSDRDWILRSLKSDALETGEITMEAFDPGCITWFSEEQVEANRQWNPAVYNVAQYADEKNNIFFALTNITADHFRSISMTAADFIRVDTSVDPGRWQTHFDAVEINAHAYPVIGVDKLTHLADFVRGIAAVTTGREFTEEELAKGANVCLISETLAAVNGLAVGDTITLSYYAWDESCAYQGTLFEGSGVINPGASYYTENTALATAQEYTIIGFYQQKYDWYRIADNLYSISPNTIIAPKSAVPVQMQYTDQGLWGALELYNGSISKFNMLLDDAGHSFLYVCYDQGYSFVKENLQNYDEIAQMAVIIGLVVYGVILALYLIMFPTRQGDTIYRMGMMGAFGQHKITHILVSGLGILLPGTVLGTLGAVLLWDRVVTALTAVVVAQLDLQLDIGTILWVSAAQLALALGLTVVVSLPLTFGRLMNRR